MKAACPACRSECDRVLLRREGVPVHQNRLARSAAEARAAARGDLELWHCARCGLVWNHAFDARRLRYDDAYTNDQTASPSFARHVEECVAGMVADGVRGRTVVEIGCGRGDFLRRLCRAGDNRGFGFDTVAPSAVYAEGGGVRLEGRRCEERDRLLGADVALARHTLEHVEDPVGVLAALRALLGDARDARLYVEIPALEWIVERRAVWDFFYEHVAYFTADALANALGLAGLRLARLARVFGGQYLWALATPGPRCEPRPPPARELASIAGLAAAETALAEHWRARAADWARRGRVAVWGAGAKGATFLHLVDPRCETICCVVDVHPAKHGRHVPGTGHPIVAPDAAVLASVRDVVVMNPNYRAEVAARLAEQGSGARLHLAELPG